jgi:hypothetical protein
MHIRSLSWWLSILLLFPESVSGQSSDFPYKVELEEVRHTNWPTLHSYALAMSKGRCLIIGGRRDGLHARQPFRSFPAGERNSRIYILDPQSGKQYSAGLESLPQRLREQLSSSNMNFVQRGDRLFLTGGYGFSETADDHITFPLLTVVNIPQLVRQLEAGRVDSLPFRTYRDERFAVTGGRMGAFGDTLLIVGGHRFDGRYNPMGHATYVQTYTHEVRRLLMTTDSEAPVFLPPLQEPLHLRRRDFNLFPFMSRDGSTGYTMAAGVFQRGMELPYLYPVDIRGDHIRAVTGFQQLLCNYHTAFTPLYDPLSGTTHTLFFGGISEYHPDNGRLVRDDRVPFVKTISRLERTEDGQYKEYLLNSTMPVLTGAASEFIPDRTHAMTSNGMILLNSSMPVRRKIGYLYGGIESKQPNPFDEDETDEATQASGTLFAVWLISDTTQVDRFVGGENPYTYEVFRDSAGVLTLSYELQDSTGIKVLFSDMSGEEVSEMEEEQRASGPYRVRYRLDSGGDFKYEFVSIVFNKRFIVTRPIPTHAD